MYASFGLGLWYGSTLIPENASFDQVIKVFMVLIMTSFAIAETLTLAPDIAKGGYAIESVFNVLDRTPEMIPDDPKGDSADHVKGDIELKHVKFSYPTRPDVTIFSDFSLKVWRHLGKPHLGKPHLGKLLPVPGPLTSSIRPANAASALCWCGAVCVPLWASA